MRRILIFGAGRSSITLIDHLLGKAQECDWMVTVADLDLQAAQHKVNGHARGEAVGADVTQRQVRLPLIAASDIVVSLLPPALHVEVAKDCLELGRNLTTASYVSKEMKQMDGDALRKGLIFLNEAGLDPGIDHLSAMHILDRLRADGATVEHFESFTGGLVAPESDDNPWGYKFTWNPRNVVLAGQGGAIKFLHNDSFKYIPYHRVFRRTETIQIDGHGRFEGYANRDSLMYREVYGLQNVHTIYRGTLRRAGFCRAWDVFVQLGATDDSYVLEGSEEMTHRQFINAFLAYSLSDSVELKLMHYLQLPQDSDVMEKLEWLGIFSREKVGLKNATPAQILQHILEKKWAMRPNDKDMIVMWHRIGFMKDGQRNCLESSMVVKGDDQEHTAMAKTVGLPLAIATRMILDRKVKQRGVVLPVHPDIYEPVLTELAKEGIHFTEKTYPVNEYVT